MKIRPTIFSDKSVRHRMIVYIITCLTTAEIILALLSWLLSTMMSHGGRSLLSSEGIRWFMGNYDTIVLSPVLVWILLASMAYGTFRHSRLTSYSGNYSERTGLRAAWVVLGLYVMACLALTVIPHAILLSATGQLFPSPFTRAIVPIVSFAVLLFSVTYGLMARSFTSISSVCQALIDGLRDSAPILLIYVLLMQFYQSLLFVFDW